MVKRCPFCGGEGWLTVHKFDKSPDTFGYRCHECGAQSYQFFETAKQAEAAWNRRSTREERR